MDILGRDLFYMKLLFSIVILNFFFLVNCRSKIFTLFQNSTLEVRNQGVFLLRGFLLLQEKQAESSWEALLANIGTPKPEAIQHLDLKQIIREKGVPLRYRVRKKSLSLRNILLMDINFKILQSKYFNDILF